MQVEIHAPSVHVLLISAVIALLALTCYLFFISYLTPVAHWIALIAYAVLGFGTTIRM
jgi:4-amino-4-deoxy-L-arabinose transferase-like glycosyltransferase